MLAKCLWKIHQHTKATDDPKCGPDAILKAVMRAVELLPARKDPSRQDPVLEPIYKVVVLAHKMVTFGKFDVCTDFFCFRIGLTSDRLLVVQK